MSSYEVPHLVVVVQQRFTGIAVRPHHDARRPVFGRMVDNVLLTPDLFSRNEKYLFVRNH